MYMIALLDFEQWRVDVPTPLEEREQSGHKSQELEYVF